MVSYLFVIQCITEKCIVLESALQGNIGNPEGTACKVDLNPQCECSFSIIINLDSGHLDTR
jgi:hypothetical protein